MTAFSRTYTTGEAAEMFATDKRRLGHLLRGGWIGRDQADSRGTWRRLTAVEALQCGVATHLLDNGIDGFVVASLVSPLWADLTIICNEIDRRGDKQSAADIIAVARWKVETGEDGQTFIGNIHIPRHESATAATARLPADGLMLVIPLHSIIGRFMRWAEANPAKGTGND